ncbi:MAG: hypothetical protein U0894_07070 [Pirellulales bacterium]
MKAEGEVVRSLGGLHVIGTEHVTMLAVSTCNFAVVAVAKVTPNSSRFFLSLEDDLMRIFAGPWVKTILDSLGMQKKASGSKAGWLADASKRLKRRWKSVTLKLVKPPRMSEVMDEQRKRVYSFRQDIWKGIAAK